MELDVRPNLPAIFLHCVHEHERERFLGARKGRRWEWISSREALAAVREIAAGLIARGLEPGDRVGLISENRPEWILADMGIQFARGVNVPVYPTLPANQAEYILKDCGARFVFVSNPDQAAKVASVRESLPDLEQVFTFDEEGSGAIHVSVLREEGRQALIANEGLVDARLVDLDPGDLATIIYTSGTTGTPKGVMLTHRNFCSNVGACAHLFRFETGDRALSFLPLSHVLERMVNYVYIQVGLSVGYVSRLERVADALGEVKPQVFVTVPRLLERIASVVREQVEEQKGMKRTLGRKMLEWALAAADDIVAGRKPRGLAALRLKMADRAILSRVRARLGGQLKFMISGGAALPADVARFFWAAGLPVYEGYGMTESSPVISVNYPGRVKLGTVGPPIVGVEVRISDEGEILARGPNVMRGYWNRPRETDETLFGGWLHTGDLGYLDPDGFLAITGRKKDIIVLSTGKNVSPVAIEQEIEKSPYVLRAVAVGDERPHIGLLIVPNVERLVEWARDRHLPVDDIPALLERAEVRRLYEGEISRHQANLAVFEKARRFEFLLEDFSEENGLLTPTQKVRRAEVLRRFGDVVEKMYS